MPRAWPPSSRSRSTPQTSKPPCRPHSPEPGSGAGTTEQTPARPSGHPRSRGVMMHGMDQPPESGNGAISRVMVGTDRSQTASRAVGWAAALAERYAAELHLVQVVVPSNPSDTEFGSAERTRAAAAAAELEQEAERIAGGRGRSHVVIDDDPAMAIVHAAEDADVDVLVVGNAGMAGRKEFLLGNVPNRISHNARCTVIIVNTTDGVATAVRDPRSVTTIRSSVVETETEPHLISRGTKIATVFAKHGLKELFGRPDEQGTVGRARQAKRMRVAMEELGPTFCKLGQILSTRPDLIPPEFIDELAQLQDHVPPLSEEQVVRVMEQELGVPWEDVFESIEPEPLAAGTIGQVHRARLEGGTRVVVKVQRPGAAEEIERDLGLFALFAEKAEGREALSGLVDIPAVVEHLSTSLRRELDFREEAGNLERMREVLARYQRLAVPWVHSQVSSRRLLVMDEIVGVPLREAPPGDERREAARQMLEAFYRQVLTEGFFHADPHPGNLLWSEGRIYLLDLGMVGILDDDTRGLLLLLLLAFWREDAEFLADVMLMLGEGSGDVDLEGLRADLADYVGQFKVNSFSDIELGPMLDTLIEIAARHGIRLPASLAMTGKAFGQMQLAVAELDPTLDPFSAVGGFMFRGLRERVGGALDPQRAIYEIQKLKVRATRLIEGVERLTGARPGPGLQIELRGSKTLEDAIRKAGRRIAIAFAGGAALLAAVLAAAASSIDLWVPVTLGVAAGIAGVALVLDLMRSR